MKAGESVDRLEFEWHSTLRRSWRCTLAMREKRINNSELARRLGVTETIVPC